MPAGFDEADERFAWARRGMQALAGDEGWAAARRTVLDAHYTDPAVVAAMWSALGRLGLRSARVLEPGCGSGNVLGVAPPGVEVIGVERDLTTVWVARVLYPDADIHNVAFQRFDLRTPVDGVIGYVPFAETRIRVNLCG